MATSFSWGLIFVCRLDVAESFDCLAGRSDSVDPADTPGFIAALLFRPDAPLPLIIADTNDDGCVNGLDVAGFVRAIGP